MLSVHCWLLVCAAAFPMFLLVSARPLLLSFAYCKTVHVKPLLKVLTAHSGIDARFGSCIRGRQGACTNSGGQTKSHLIDVNGSRKDFPSINVYCIALPKQQGHDASSRRGGRKKQKRGVRAANCGRDDLESGNRLWVWDCGKEVSPEGESSRRSSGSR
jgi:hypothetical protein